MNAVLLLREQLWLSDDAKVEIVIWRLPRRVPGSLHDYKYRIALIANGVCVLRYDNEAGKGDHKHIDEAEAPYRFVDLETLQGDFEADVAAWRLKQ